MKLTNFLWSLFFIKPFSILEGEGGGSVENSEISTAEALNMVIDESTKIAEEQTENVAEEQKEDPDLARKFAALSRKDKEIRELSKTLEEREALLDQKLKEFEEKNKEPEKIEIPWKTRLLQNPMKFLEEEGLPYDKLTELALNDGKPDTSMQMQLMRQEIREELKKEMEEQYSPLAKKIESYEKAEADKREAQAQESLKNEIQGFLEKNTEEYEITHSQGAIQEVFNVMEAHYNETGKLLDISEAAKAVEDWYQEQAEKLLKTKKFASARQEVKSDENKASTSESPTLSNAHSANAQSVADRMLTDDESKQAAASILKWE